MSIYIPVHFWPIAVTIGSILWVVYLAATSGRYVGIIVPVYGLLPGSTLSIFAWLIYWAFFC